MKKQHNIRIAIYIVFVTIISNAILIFRDERNIQKNSFIPTDVPVIEIGSNLTGSSIKSGKQQFTGLVINKECEVISTGDYKITEIMVGQNYSPLNPKKWRTYTKSFNVSGKFEEAYGCIVSDLVDYRKKHHVYIYSTYILFNDPEYAGHINVGFNKETQKTYNEMPNLNGRFWGDEAPKIYTTKEMDLSDLFVADLKNGGYKKINILDRLNKGGLMYIGGFVNALNGEGIMKKFIIAYKCKEGITCEIK